MYRSVSNFCSLLVIPVQRKGSRQVCRRCYRSVFTLSALTKCERNVKELGLPSPSTSFLGQVSSIFATLSETKTEIDRGFKTRREKSAPHVGALL